MASIWDIIGAAGNVLDLPGSSVRDVLALENPLDQWLTPTTGENRVGGRQLLDQWGITPENEETGMAGWLDNPMEGVRDVAGFAVEATLDPLNLVSGSAIARAFKGGVAARKANAARTALLESPERARVLDEMGQAFGPGAAPTMDVLDSFALGQQGMPPESVYSRLSAGPAAPLAEDVLFQPDRTGVGPWYRGTYQPTWVPGLEVQARSNEMYEQALYAEDLLPEGLEIDDLKPRLDSDSFPGGYFGSYVEIDLKGPAIGGETLELRQDAFDGIPHLKDHSIQPSVPGWTTARFLGTSGKLTASPGVDKADVLAKVVVENAMSVGHSYLFVPDGRLLSQDAEVAQWYDNEFRDRIESLMSLVGVKGEPAAQIIDNRRVDGMTWMMSEDLWGYTGQSSAEMMRPAGELSPLFTSKVYAAIQDTKFPKVGNKNTMINALKKAGVSKRELDSMLPEIDRAASMAEGGKLVKDQLGAIAEEKLAEKVRELTIETFSESDVAKAKRAAIEQAISDGVGIPRDQQKHLGLEHRPQFSYYTPPGGIDDDYAETVVRHPAAFQHEKVPSHLGSAKEMKTDQRLGEPILHVRQDISEIPIRGSRKTARLLEIQSDYHQEGQRYGYTDESPVDFPKWEPVGEESAPVPAPGTTELDNPLHSLDPMEEGVTVFRPDQVWKMPGTDLTLKRDVADEFQIYYKGRPVFGSKGKQFAWATPEVTRARMSDPEFQKLYKERDALLEKYEEVLNAEKFYGGTEYWAYKMASARMDAHIGSTILRKKDVPPLHRAPFEKDWEDLGLKLFLDKAVKDGADSVFLPDGRILAKFVGGPEEALGKFYNSGIAGRIDKLFGKYGITGRSYSYDRNAIGLGRMEMDTGVLFRGPLTGVAWEIPQELRKKIAEEGQTLYQPNRGQAAFSGDSARLSPLENPDFSTPLHESGHVMRRLLGEANPDLAQRAGELFGGGQQWDRAAEERFAQGLERYAQTARPESPALRQTMDQFRPELDQIYRENPLSDLNQAQTALYDEILGIRGQLSPLDRRRSPSLAKPMLAAVLQNMAARQERM